MLECHCAMLKGERGLLAKDNSIKVNRVTTTTKKKIEGVAGNVDTNENSNVSLVLIAAHLLMSVSLLCTRHLLPAARMLKAIKSLM